MTILQTAWPQASENLKEQRIRGVHLLITMVGNSAHLSSMESTKIHDHKTGSSRITHHFERSEFSCETIPRPRIVYLVVLISIGLVFWKENWLKYFCFYFALPFTPTPNRRWNKMDVSRIGQPLSEWDTPALDAFCFENYPLCKLETKSLEYLPVFCSFGLTSLKHHNQTDSLAFLWRRLWSFQLLLKQSCQKKSRQINQRATHSFGPTTSVQLRYQVQNAALSSPEHPGQWLKEENQDSPFLPENFSQLLFPFFFSRFLDQFYLHHVIFRPQIRPMLNKLFALILFFSNTQQRHLSQILVDNKRNVNIPGLLECLGLKTHWKEGSGTGQEECGEVDWQILWSQNWHKGTMAWNGLWQLDLIVRTTITRWFVWIWTWHSHAVMTGMGVIVDEVHCCLWHLSILSHDWSAQ